MVCDCHAKLRGEKKEVHVIAAKKTKKKTETKAVETKETSSD